MKMTRRGFHAVLGGAAFSPAGWLPAAEPPNRRHHPDLEGKTGIVTASLSAHIAAKAAPGKITLLDLPQFLSGELGMEILDFNSMNFPSFEPSYLETLRHRIEAAGCLATNLKLNQKVDMNSPDPDTRGAAMAVYKRSVDAATLLGCRWVRPLPRAETPDRKRHVAAFGELIDYAGERGITVLIENYGWMMNDPGSVVELATEIGTGRVGVGLDTGNWATNEVRYPALEKTFPLAVTCDFKAKGITAEMEHPAYDLERCFRIGWKHGFRGPWAFEHGHRDLETAKRHLVWMREQVEKWSAAPA